MEWSKWRNVWIIVLFDLPTETKEQRRDYSEFRKALLEDGFVMMQYSVYIRHCPSEENAAVHDRRIVKAIPPNGEIRVLQITDAQFARMKVFHGKLKIPTESVGEQLEFF